ncbi:MAG TPA: magnesium-translocating P-type ATPase [Bryobacteraceae bacterium]|nr:magnesium-translocating P-type ATPase [Bryobacteraceae bacterium]
MSSALAPPVPQGFPGLTSEEAARRLEQFGPNDPAPVRAHSALLAFVQLFLNPLVLILLLAAGISGFTGSPIDAGIIVVVVLLGLGLDFIQTNRSQHTIERLRERVAPAATVLRDGQWREIPRPQVVPGDILHLAAGDLIPADARLVEAKDLFVQQAALTGESLPVEKTAAALEKAPMAPADASKTDDPGAPDLIFLGSSVVSGTAAAEVIATGTQTSFGAIAARLQGRAAETAFDRGLRSFSGLIARTVLFLVLFLISISIAQHRDPLQSLLFAVALAVGLTPEFLPMITSVTLSKGALAMARKKVVVKHLSAIQNFGSIDVLCSDKTGTLTSGNVELTGAADLAGEDSSRVRLLGYLNSFFETGIRSPFDKATCAIPVTGVESYQKIDEIPFDFERRRASIVVAQNGERLLITKGAPEGILPLAHSYEQGDGVYSFDDAARAQVRRYLDQLSAKGFRVLAVASVKVPDRPAYSTADEINLTLAGFLSFEDPPLPDAREAVAAMLRDGVAVKMITGDNELVARHVCGEVGLDIGPRAEGLITSEEFAKTSDNALAQVADQTTVFTRINPAGKSRILAALRHAGHVVGFMGDGINDAPSLRAADVGVSVATATDVAREAADIILLEPGLGVLHEGIVEGRKAFGNVMKYLLMGTSSNFGNMLSMAGASVFLPFLPMLPTQILLNNFLYDLAQISIPTDHVDESFLRKPQHWDVKLIRNFMIFIGPISSIFDFLTFYVLLRYFHAPEAEFHTGWFVESLATQTLVLFVIRTAGNPFQSRPSLPLAVTTVAIVVIGVMLPFTPLGALLGFVPLPGSYFAFLGIATATYLAMVEFAKRWMMPKPV